jgi:signal peptidase I
MGPARPPPARAAGSGMPPEPRRWRRRRSEPSQPADSAASWPELLAEDAWLPAADDDPGGGRADEYGAAHDPPPPWSNGSGPNPDLASGPPRTSPLPWTNGSAPGGFELPGEPGSNGHAGAWPEQPAWTNGSTGGQPEPPGAPWAGDRSSRPGSQAADADSWWGPLGGQSADPSQVPWTGAPDGTYGSGPPLAGTAPAPPSNVPLAWVDEPTAPGAPDLHASWPGMPDAHRPGAREADRGEPPGPPDGGMGGAAEPRGWPGPGAIQPGEPGRAHLPSPAGSSWDQREGARPSAAPSDPWADPGHAANPAMPSWDYPTQPGGPAIPSGPWADPGHPGATAAMPAGPPVRGPLPPSPPRRPAPGSAGHGGTWRTLDDVELPESRMDRFGDDGLQRSRGGARAGFWAEVPVLVVAAVVLAVLVKGFLVQAFYIPSRSMEPTLDVGDRVVVNRLSYRLGAPQRGQVVVFLRQTGGRAAAPESPVSWVRRAVAQGLGGAPPGSEDLIKRVVAGPGEVVQGGQGRVWVNGRALVEPYLRAGSFTSDFGPLRVPPGHYWVMGDNREDSSDSRVFGPIPRSALVGRAVGTVWPPQRLGRL